MGNPNASELEWLLDDLIKRVAGARWAVVLSSDGLLMGSSQELTQADGEHLSAVASGLQSLAKGASRHVGGGQVRQTVIEMDDAFLLVTTTGQGACLAVVTTAHADMGAVAYEMNHLIKKVGAYFVAHPRNQADSVRS